MIIEYDPTEFTRLKIRLSKKSPAGIDIVGNELRVYDDDEVMTHREKVADDLGSIDLNGLIIMAQTYVPYMKM